MVQVLPPRAEEEGKAERFGKIFGGTGSNFIQSKMHAEGQKVQREHELKLKEREYQLKGENALNLQKEKTALDAGNIEEGYQTVKNMFGEPAAEIWRHAPTGGKTELLKHFLDAKQRGINLDEVLGPYAAHAKDNPNAFEDGAEHPFGEESMEGPQNAPLPPKKGEHVPDYKLDFGSRNPKEKIELEETNAKANAPIWKKNIEDFKDFKDLERDVNQLEKINEKKNLPEGFSKLLLNPETGDFYDVSRAVKEPHPDAQLYIKILAKQATKAQTAFPGRVTNFDLQSYMRQFPSLFNTYEGRKNILSLLKLDTQARKLYAKNLDDVYSKYKTRGIFPEDAERMAMEMSQPEIDKLEEEMLEIVERSGTETPSEGNEDDEVDVIGPNGEEFTAPRSKISELPEGYRVK